MQVILKHVFVWVCSAVDSIIVYQGSSGSRYAELNGNTRSFTPEEEDLFDRSAEFAYASFRDKAAESRGIPKEELQQHAQGRVWSGKRALQNGLIDGLGGVDRAIGIAKQAAGIGRHTHTAW